MAHVAVPVAVGTAALAFAGWAISLAVGHAKFPLWGPAHMVGVLCIAFGLAVWVRHPEAQRIGWLRARRPAWAAGAVIAAALAAFLVAGLTRASTHVMGVLLLSYAAALLLLGFALLLGVLRGTVANWQSLELLLERTRQGADAGTRGHSPQDVLQSVLRDALDDPTLALHLWSRKTREYLDASGEPAVLPTTGSSQEVTTVMGAGHVPLAALAHDPCLQERPELRRRLNMVLDVATLALQNARLDAETNALPRRLLDLERDIREQLQEMLHDRVQHRLTAIQLLLGQARKCVSDERQQTSLRDRVLHRLPAIQFLLGQARKSAGDYRQLAGLLAQMTTELQDAVHELREVTKDIFPVTLHKRGLGAELASRFRRPPVPMVMLVEDRRWSPQIEMTAYLTITEAVGNSWRHADASKITVRAESAGNDLLFEVSDDGVGGAAPHREGTGLRRMRDRVMAHGGTFSLDSPPGQGTTIRACLPPT